MLYSRENKNKPLVEMDKFTLKLFSTYSAPVCIHASSILVLLYFVANKGFLFGIFATIAFFILMYIHELGHAYFVRYYGHDLERICLYPLHGVCEFDIDERYSPETLIIAGGILFQLGVFSIWFVLVTIFDRLGFSSLIHLVEPFTFIFLSINLLTIVINLLPIRGLDGYELWLRLYYTVKTKFSGISKKLNRKRTQPSSQKVVELAIAKAKKKK